MNENFYKFERLSNIALATGLLAAIGGYVYKTNAPTIIGLLAAGASLAARSCLYLQIFRRAESNSRRERLADFADAYLAACQLSLGVAILILTVAEAAAAYVSSGAFWEMITATVPPGVLLLIFGLFLASIGAAQILSRLSAENNGLSAVVRNFSEVARGIVFLIFGLFFTALALLVLAF